ncbi:uncharacterized protein LOC132199076 isoform X2 [Neocloeon triangulifer]|uniref:uncharacterized protein LOC132199076 isoform X2 n=2 Tax=Neocloeon triangulifer TaxID=2078957 RepID=UPI00286FAD96|nr:uncharacterized protein LOC132199076 isoform X2 [Neocloeon triangulifer]
MRVIAAFIIVLAVASTNSQRISTIQLDGTQYFISRLNPYAPELNYFLAYQYCRSLGLQLTSFETKEKADTLTQYMKNAGLNKYEFWTSGNKLGTSMLLWMSTGLPFNATFNYLNHESQIDQADPSINAARHLDVSALGKSCVSLSGANLEWTLSDCGAVKDFICEQTRCYYYNYGSIPVSATQGKPIISTTVSTLPPNIYDRPTTPYPYVHNSVAPEDDDHKLEALTELAAAEEQEAEDSEQTTDETTADGEYDVSSVHEDEHIEASSPEEETVSSPEHQQQPMQPKRLEDLFPLERTRPVNWQRN